MVVTPPFPPPEAGLYVGRADLAWLRSWPTRPGFGQRKARTVRCGLREFYYLSQIRKVTSCADVQFPARQRHTRLARAKRVPEPNWLGSRRKGCPRKPRSEEHTSELQSL